LKEITTEVNVQNLIEPNDIRHDSKFIFTEIINMKQLMLTESGYQEIQSQFGQDCKSKYQNLFLN